MKTVRPRIRRSQVQEGTVLVADGGFTCIAEGEKLIVMRDSIGGHFGFMYVLCDRGTHPLYLQEDQGDYIGFTVIKKD